MTRQPDWDVDRLRGEEAEALVRATRNGILLGTTEVKRDDGALKYGNVFLEFACRQQSGAWSSSGIATTKSSTWAHVFWPVVVAAPTWMVRNIAREAKQRGDIKECVVGTNPTKGAVVSVSQFLPTLIEHASRPLTDERKAA